MPTASDELRDKMGEWFGDRISDGGPSKHLESRGYSLTRGWEWVPPNGVKNYEDMEEKDYLCLMFLVHEWDFGGLYKCPLQKEHGDVICIDGKLWALTYSEMGPPDSRQCQGVCPHCAEASKK